MKRRIGQPQNKLKGFYPVEAIRAKRTNIHTGKDEYLIKWQGWEEKSNTWEPISNVVGCEELIENFQSHKKTNNQESTTRQNDHSMDIPLKSTQNFQKGIEHFLSLLYEEMGRRVDQTIQTQKVSQNQLKVPDQRELIQIQQELQKPQEKVLRQSRLQKQINKIIEIDPILQNKHQIRQNLCPSETQKIMNCTKSEETNTKSIINLDQAKLKKSTKYDLLTRRRQRKCQNGKEQQMHDAKKIHKVKRKGIRVSEKQIQNSKARISDINMINGQINYVVEDYQNKNICVYATKEDLIRINPLLLLRFYEDKIN